VDRKNELDPNFVVMAQCYTGEAANGGLEEALRRMQAYKEVAGVDWVQFTAPRSAGEAKRARDLIDGPFSIMQGFMDKPLTNKELLELGITIAWGGATHQVTYVAMYDYIRDFVEREDQATRDFQEAHKDNPYVRDGGGPRDRSQSIKQRELEEKYLSSDTLEKYQKSAGRRQPPWSRM
jgi:2-methylisocitrate lyase-like PEP mutase family enzyme